MYKKLKENFSTRIVGVLRVFLAKKQCRFCDKVSDSRNKPSRELLYTLTLYTKPFQMHDIIISIDLKSFLSIST